MKIAFIGGGKMGEAILAALLRKKLCKPADVSVADVSRNRLDFLQDRYHVAVIGDNKEAIVGKDAIVLAVKPQQMPDVLAGLKGSLKPEQLALSIAAGVKIGTIAAGLAHDKIVRAMPNTPAQIALGMTGWTATSHVTARQKELAQAVLGAMGEEIYFDDEEDLDKITAVSGSGPAYFYLFTEALIDAAMGLGLKRENAIKLALQTSLGAALLMSSSGKLPDELRHEVASKGGTTERAIQTFEQNDLSGIVAKAVNAAYQRARELGQTPKP